MLANVQHYGKRKAILFSDLHYSYETKKTCFQVLRFVHQKATEDRVCLQVYPQFNDIRRTRHLCGRLWCATNVGLIPSQPVIFKEASK